MKEEYQKALKNLTLLLDIQWSYKVGPVRPSILLSVFRPVPLPGCFLRIISLAFSKFWHGARSPYEVVRDRAGFFGKNFCCSKNWESGPKIRFFEFVEIRSSFLLNLFYNENLYYWLRSCTNPVFGKKLFLRYRVKYFQIIRLQDFLINRISRKNKKHNCSGFSLFKIQSNQKLVHHCQHSRNQLNSLILS